MRVWCALNQKGGVGKTSLLLSMLIVAWLRLGKVCLVDLDPQRSAEKWWNLRAARTDETQPVIEFGMAGRLREMLAAAEQQGVQLALVDTPGSLDRAMARAAAEAHLIIVPTRTSSVDVQSLEDTLGFLEDIKALGKAVVVVNCARARDPADAVHALAQRFRVPVAAVTMRDRAEFAKALDEGRGITEKSAKSVAAKEIQELFDWLRRHEEAFAGSARQATA